MLLTEKKRAFLLAKNSPLSQLSRRKALQYPIIGEMVMLIILTRLHLYFRMQQHHVL
jgi:hypothetical protein